MPAKEPTRPSLSSPTRRRFLAWCFLGLGLLVNEWSLLAIFGGAPFGAFQRALIFTADLSCVVAGLLLLGADPREKRNHAGWAVILAGASINEWLLRAVGLVPEIAVWEIPHVGRGVIEEAARLAIRLMSGVVMLLGILLLSFRPRPAKLALCALSLLVCLIGFELILPTDLMNQLDRPNPTWIPRRFTDLDEALIRDQWQEAAGNPFGFRDRVRRTAKPEGAYRIAILGDSFVWGHGVDRETIWSHKLEAKVRQSHENVEVMSWALPGWSTLDEYRFLTEQGIRFDVDTLIVGFVVNDLSLGDVRQKLLVWDAALPEFLHTLFPNTIDFVAAHANTLLAKFVLPDYEYENWNLAQYEPENMARYEQLLRELSAFCRERHIELIFALTPHSHDEYHERLHRKVIPLLERVGIEYLDLWPALREQCGQLELRELWANPANPHPNGLATELFAEEVFRLIEDRLPLPEAPGEDSAVR